MKEAVYKLTGSTAISIALIADTHNTNSTPILASLQSHNPDLICIAGDILVGYRPRSDEPIIGDQEHVLPLISGCVAIAPTYISLGNHEWMVSSDDVELLEKAGAVVLDNRYVSHTCENGTKIVIGGLSSAIVTNFQQFRTRCYADGTDMNRYPYRPKHTHAYEIPPEATWLSNYEAQTGYKILLCHHPEYWSLRVPYLINHPIDLILSGHAHGGQVRIFNQGLYTPGQGWMPKFTSGVFEGEHGKMIISRGLANTACIPRLFNEPEIVYVEVEKI